MFHETAKLFLLFLRRRAITFLPPTVLMRFRNPWRRDRFLVFGWYVLFGIGNIV